MLVGVSVTSLELKVTDYADRSGPWFHSRALPATWLWQEFVIFKKNPNPTVRTEDAT